jgi:hypothetical protein
MKPHKSMMVGSAFFVAVWCFPLGALGQSTTLPPGSKISPAGDVITPPAAGGEGANLELSLRPSNLSNHYVLPILKHKSLENSEHDIETALNDLFDNWPDARSKYAFYLQLLAQKIDIKNAAGAVLQQTPGSTYLLRYYTLNHAELGITTVVPPQIKPLSAFQASPADAIFVQLDGLGSPRVPVEIAKLVEADFINGFVTRLFLGACLSIWKDDPNYLKYHPSLTLNANGGNSFLSPGALPVCVNPATYPAGSALKDDLANVLSSNPITSVGMMYGWQAADDLQKFDTADRRFTKDAWKLLNYRISFPGIGRIVAYTLNYISGEAQNQRIAAIIGGANPPTQSISAIIDHVKADPAVQQSKDFITSFGNIVDTEFYAVSRAPKLKGQPRIQLLTQYVNFMEGYRNGANQAAEVLYKEVAELADGLGYANGFKDGYTSGFAAGYLDGYANGSAAAWSAANAIIAGLQSQIGNLQTQLNNVTAAQNGEGSGGGFWDTVGNIVSAAGTVIGIIGSLF